jgi:hypothetical protein
MNEPKLRMQARDAAEYCENNYMPELGDAVRDLLGDHARLSKQNADLRRQVRDLEELLRREEARG